MVILLLTLLPGKIMYPPMVLQVVKNFSISLDGSWLVMWDMLFTRL
tara:strand:- start:363 stop:500 length:138 start_codon:yes stop_codon:yes gene_type:complete